MRLPLILITFHLFLFALACVQDRDKHKDKSTKNSLQKTTPVPIHKTTEIPKIVLPKRMRPTVKDQVLPTRIDGKNEYQIVVQKAQRISKAYCACSGKKERANSCRAKLRKTYQNILIDIKEDTKKRCFESAFKYRIMACQ